MIEIRAVTKRYGETLAVSEASVVLEAGRIHAIVGENGAGKSTLLKIAAGIVAPDSGKVLVDGQRLSPHTAAAGIRAGIGMVAQHFSLVPVFTALDNVLLGFEPRTGVFIDRDAAAKRAHRVLEELETKLDLATVTSELGASGKPARAFASVDGDLLLVPQTGALECRTELGWLRAAPGSILVIPRGIKFAIGVPEAGARGWMLEVQGTRLRLPERGPIGSNGLADARHFLAPVAAYEDRACPGFQLVQKLGGGLWMGRQER